MAEEDQELAEIEDVEVDEEEEELLYDEDDSNLIPAFEVHPEGQRALSEIAEEVLRCASEALDSMTDYREQMAENYRILTSELKPKEYPWKDCSNPHLPIALENISRVTSRIAFEIFGDWDQMFAYPGMGPEDEEAAELMTAHDNWQFAHMIKGFRNEMERGLLQFIFQGDSFAQSLYDPIERQNCHTILTSDDLIIPYASVTSAPDMSDVPYKIRILRYYQHDLEQMRDTWSNVDEVINPGPPPTGDTEVDEPISRAAADASNIAIPDDQGKNSPFQLYWFEGYLNLPKQKNRRYCRAVMDTASRKLLQLMILEEAPWDEHRRYQEQLAHQQEYLQAVQNYEQHYVPAIELDNELRARLQDPDVDPQEAATLQAGLDAEPPLPQLQPQPTGWLTGVSDPATAMPEAPRKRPVSTWSHMSCIMPLKGCFGMSLGRIQADISRAANTALAQFTDAAHLANNWSIIAPHGMKFEKGFGISPGKINYVQGLTGPEISKSLIPIKPDQANPQLIDLVRMMTEWGQSSMQSPDVLSGQAGKSGETYRGLASRIEQAYKQLGFYASRYAEFFRQIIAHNADLNARHLDEDVLVDVFDHMTNRMRELRVGRGYWQERKRFATIRADMRFSTVSQRVQEADELGQLPQIMPHLQANAAYMHKATRKMLEARGADDMIDVLGPEPPPPQPMMQQPMMPGQMQAAAPGPEVPPEEVG